MRGASALQDLLQEFQDRGPSVLVVWEPVIWTDKAPPIASVLALLSDPRAKHFWDEGRLVSQAMARSGEGGPERSEEERIAWDCVAVFPPGARWDEVPPSPDYFDGPVVRVIDEVRRHLRSLQRR